MSCCRWLSLALLLMPMFLRAQTVFRVPVPLIVAPTSVTDHSGNFVNGLTAADFTLYDNGVPQQIHEDGDFLPISLAVAIESDLKRDARQQIRQLGPMLTALVVGVGGEAAILSFNDKLDVRQNFTSDLGRLSRGLRRFEFSPGPSHLIDATLDAVHLLDQRPEERRRILLLISEPGDKGSLSTLDDALADVAMSNSLIYWLNVARNPAPGDPAAAMTRYTGGREYTLHDQRALERAITEIGDEIHGQYLLTYTPPQTNATGFHRIRVVAKRSGVEVRSRPGYWPPHEP